MDLVERFINYTKFDTQSSEESTSVPSTAKQLEFAKYLKKELEDEGLSDVEMDDMGYIYATLKSNTKKKTPTIGFISHMDTSPDASGKDVKARVIKNYDGNDIELEYVDALEHNGVSYMAFFPTADTEEEAESAQDFGLVILKSVVENGEEFLATPDTDEELNEKTESVCGLIDHVSKKRGVPVHSVANVEEFSGSKKELLARLADVACQLQTKEAIHQNINVWLYRGLAALEDESNAAINMLAEANAMEAAAALA